MMRRWFCIGLLSGITRLLNAEESIDRDRFRYPSCSICPGANEPLLGNLVLPANTAGVLPFTMTCSQAQAMARSGSFSPATCILLRSRIYDLCVCAVVATDAPSIRVPTVVPTSVPSAVTFSAAPIAFIKETTSSPTSSPTASPSIPQSEAPTPTRAPVAAMSTTTIYLRLDGVTGPLDETEQAAFQRACLLFVADKVPEANNNIICELASRRSRRRLQQDSSFDLTINVSSQNYSGDDFSGEVIQAFNEDGVDFVEELKLQSDYFDNVTAVTASDEPLPRVLKPIPVSRNNGSLPPGGIAALVVGGAAAVMLISAGAYFVSRPRPDERAELPKPNDRVARPRPGDRAELPRPGEGDTRLDENPLQIEVDQGNGRASESIMLYPPNQQDGNEEIPVPVAAAVVATSLADKPVDLNREPMGAATKNSGGEQESVGGISEMEGYSTQEVEEIGSSRNDESDAKNGASSSVSSSALSSLRQNMVSRTVVAPPGKLGIVIDTTLEGPVVHKINPKSPLQGFLFPGDIIVAVDDVDTRAMPASAITALMVRTSGVRRKLTVLSDDSAGV